MQNGTTVVSGNTTPPKTHITPLDIMSAIASHDGELEGAAKLLKSNWIGGGKGTMLLAVNTDFFVKTRYNVTVDELVAMKVCGNA